MDAERVGQTFEDDWGVTWEGHYERQLTWGLEATPSQRLAWLEEAIRFADSLGVLPPPSADRDSRSSG